MLIIGLTGSIAMGKSAACRYLASKGVPVWSADEVVHEIYAGPDAVLIETAFPGTVVEGRVDRQKLAAQLIDKPHNMQKLEAIIHPLVEQKRAAFIEQHKKQGSAMALLDIPLLYEKKLDRKVDVVVLVTAPPDVQKERAMARPGMSEQKLVMILSHQLSDADKRARADFIIDTSGPFEQTHKALDQFLESVQDWPQKAK